MTYEIYYINSKSSMDITIPITFLSNWDIDSDARGVSVKGNTYWIAQDKLETLRIPDFLLCFDFTTERFGPRLSLPFHSSVGDTVTLSSARDEQLAVLFQRWDSLKLEIWITIKIEPEVVSWSKFLAVDMEPPVEFPVGAGSFFVDEDKKVVVVFNKDHKDGEKREHYIAYIIGEDGYFKTVDFWEAKVCSCHPHMCAYVPSLVQIKEPARDGKRKRITKL